MSFFPEDQNFKTKHALLNDSAFEELLAEVQPRIRGYVASMLGGVPEVDDIVQETNIVILHKKHTFEAGTNFVAWSLRIAQYKIRSWRRNQRREQVAMLKEQTFAHIESMAVDYFENRQPVIRALEQCLKLLPHGDREMIRAKYFERVTLVDQAQNSNRSAEALRKQMSRLRLVLKKCIENKINYQST